MKKSVCFIVCFFTFLSVFAQSKPLYELPENSVPKKNDGEQFLVGTDNGLYSIRPSGICEILWNQGKVDRLIRAGNKYYFVTESGIVCTEDLVHFTELNNGLPFLTIKSYDSQSKQKTLNKKPALLKDLCADPFNPDILVTATKDSVYLTTDGGKNWKNIGSSSMKTGGMKAVAVCHMPVYGSNGEISSSELVVFMSHPIYGFSYYRVETKNPKWVDVSAGFEIMKSLTQVDEIADILPVLEKNKDGKIVPEIYVTQTYLPNIYKFDWKTKRAVQIYSDSKNLVNTFDGLCQSNSSIVFSTMGKIQSLSLNDNTVSDIKKFPQWKKQMNLPRSIVNCAYIPKSITGTTPLELNELWLLNPDVVLTPWGEKANHRKAVYVSAYQMRNMEGIAKYKKIISQNKLNALVIDMKDDYGLLRFEPESQMLKTKGKVTQYKIDVNQFVEEFKKDGTYLIARIVVFKDRNLSNYDQKQYAVWDSVNNKPWVGIKGNVDVTDEDGKLVGTKTDYYDENWVDPYSEEVWEYNIEIAKELIRRGFDEIQFDYIRFPTDGINLSKARYRWRDSGMDKESALVSFLSYARKNINAPIGIDIYGANGWYRSGTRTGQDVELMSEYVDVICPMFYPSHFEQDFLEYKPAEERTYRIYFYGSYRNTVMGRNRIVVRPWVQAFYMGVRYDRKYYNKDYVLRQIFGTRDGIDRGYMYWNNSGGWYDDISPDPQDNELSPWKIDEADLQEHLPAFSGDKDLNNITDYRSMKNHNQQMIELWQSVIEQEDIATHQMSRNLLLIN